MTVAHLWRAIQDRSSGHLLYGATVTLCNPGTQTPISATLYSDVALTQQIPNPFTASLGVIDVYLSEPQTVLLLTTYGSSSEQVDNLAIMPLAEQIVTTESPVHIINSPGANTILYGVDGENAQFGALPPALAGTAAVALGWFLTDAFQYANIVRDANGAMTGADITWPDGTLGSYVADTVSVAFPGKVDAWHATRSDGVTTTTYTQPAVTRDVNGNITIKPLVTVA